MSSSYHALHAWPRMHMLLRSGPHVVPISRTRTVSQSHVAADLGHMMSSYHVTWTVSQAHVAAHLGHMSSYHVPRTTSHAHVAADLHGPHVVIISRYKHDYRCHAYRAVPLPVIHLSALCTSYLPRDEHEWHLEEATPRAGPTTALTSPVISNYTWTRCARARLRHNNWCGKNISILSQNI